MRLFIAIDPPKDCKRMIADEVERLFAGFETIKWVKTENFHLTLKFLGNHPEEKIPKIKEAISKSLLNLKSFSLSVDKISFFDRLYLVIFLEIKGNNELNKLSGILENELSEFGIKKDRKKIFHITLARVRKLQELEKEELIKKIKEMQFKAKISFSVKEISLFESKLTGGPPIYQPIAKFALG